jgi:hypothetical protein
VKYFVFAAGLFVLAPSCFKIVEGTKQQAPVGGVTEQGGKTNHDGAGKTGTTTGGTLQPLPPGVYTPYPEPTAPPAKKIYIPIPIPIPIPWGNGDGDDNHDDSKPTPKPTSKPTPAPTPGDGTISITPFPTNSNTNGVNVSVGVFEAPYTNLTQLTFRSQCRYIVKLSCVTPGAGGTSCLSPSGKPQTTFRLALFDSTTTQIEPTAFTNAPILVTKGVVFTDSLKQPDRTKAHWILGAQLTDGENFSYAFYPVTLFTPTDPCP